MMNVGMNPFLGQQVSCVNNLSFALCVLHYFSSNITDRMYHVSKSFTWFDNMVALAMQAEFVSNCSLFLSCSLWNLGAL